MSLGVVVSAQLLTMGVCMACDTRASIPTVIQEKDEPVSVSASAKVGSIAITGRFHRPPKTLAQSYDVKDIVLGSGFNGNVHQATGRKVSSNSLYAVKGFSLQGVSAEKRQELELECEIFLGMDHPNVGRLVDVFKTPRRLDLVMECMSGGEVYQRIRKKRRYSETEAANAIYQMLLAICYLHSHGVVHRDIKLENFLYDSEDSETLKLIDFGFSRYFHADTKMSLSCGTLAYVAPEVLNRDYSYHCDMWSFGVCVFILLLGYLPFQGAEQGQMQRIKTGQFVRDAKRWNQLSPEARQYIESLLVIDPQGRLTAEQALQAPWVVKRHQAAHIEIDRATVDAMVGFGAASQFRRAAMSMMAWSLSNEERQEVESMFLALDKDKSGAISIQEFRQVVEDQFHIEDARVKGIFSALDPDHNHEIHYSDFLAAMVSTRIALHDDILKQAFERFDVDNSGDIAHNDLKIVMGDSHTEQEIDDLIAEADESQDGHISYEEWIHFCRQGNNPNARSSAARLIDSEIDKRTQDQATDALVKSGVALFGRSMRRKSTRKGCS